jgi:hypothetical protein
MSLDPTRLASTDVRIRHLFERKSFVASFDSTSQYAQGGSSGLASLNAVRMLDRELKMNATYAVFDFVKKEAISKKLLIRHSSHVITFSCKYKYTKGLGTCCAK